jgi:hypothetical protein
MEEQKRIFPKGIYFNEPHPKAPHFIKGKVSINVEAFKQFIDDNPELINEKGYLRLDLLEKKQEDKYGKYNFQVDTWKPDGSKTNTEDNEEKEISIDDLPL